MYNKLSRQEQKIIRDTIRQGEESSAGRKPGHGQLVKAILWFSLIFLILAIAFKLMIGLV